MADQISSAETAVTADPFRAAIVCQGRLLSSAELLGLAAPPVPRRRALPMLLSAWLALLVVLSNPLAALATLFAAPLLLAYVNGRRPA